MIDSTFRQVPPAFAKITDKYDRIYVIVSPPRCSSTAFSRVFWEQPSVRYYSHEPFETTYFMGQGLDDVAERLNDPIDLQTVKKNAGIVQGNSLVIKEMPYQVGPRFSLLAQLATKPLVFLMRDPRLNIASRMAKKREVGDSPFFPLIETGWELLAAQIKQCQEQQIPHMIVDAADFRNYPEATFSQVFARLQLPFGSETVTWRPSNGQVNLDNLDGEHTHLYDHVLQSKRMEPDTEPIPPVDSFPTTNGFRAHVVECLQIYEELKRSPAKIVLA